MTQVQLLDQERVLSTVAKTKRRRQNATSPSRRRAVLSTRNVASDKDVIFHVNTGEKAEQNMKLILN